ncbi:MAG: 16S rRNA (cytidine(1402)-2'-O)-methyltransferase [Spirochaetia bacterium]|jgi:16S rRNA (cytidine1402-2'-O)-methyltransferase|nr:16S rRNA (cytidine(1402)-2'-O)-methyltransferase [Spirochaetia bacterium]
MGTLYIVATPIGNLDDITFRAVETLKNADVIACEDTRHTRVLLNRYEIKKPLISYYAADEEKGIGKILALLEKGENVAYVSDAGTPGMSDPGGSLVRRCREKGFDIVPIPGVSAFTALVSVSGAAGRGITFDGFLSPKKGKRRGRLTELLERDESFVVYESPYRVLKLLEDLKELAPERRIIAGRELTKKFEEILSGTAEDIIDILAGRSKIQGELSILICDKKYD